MKGFVVMLWALMVPVLAWANADLLDQAYEAYDAGDFDRTIALGEQILAGDPDMDLA